MRPGTLSFLAAPLFLLACGEDYPGPGAEAPLAPPDGDLPGYQIERVRNWFLVGNDLTPGDDTLELRVSAPAGTEVVDAWIADRPGVRLEPRNAGFELTADIADLPAGDHTMLLAANGGDTAFAAVQVRRSHPYYVLVTTDWDYSDPSDQALAFQDTLHDDHPGALITHFVGPYTFTDDAVVDDAREAVLVDWLAEQRDEHDDEIALHIHPYCNFVEYAGLTCITNQSTVYSDDPSGYTVRVEAYRDTDFRTLLETADELFMERGLGKPVTFRAGGWTASIETLRALAATGYVADTSANNWARLEEWNRVMGATLYQWNMENWSSIGDTSQPYYPNEDVVLSAAAPTLPILEVPDNAIMVDYVSVEEMTAIFEANWDGGPLAQPVAYMMGLHPSEGLSLENKARTDGLLDLTDRFWSVDDKGPVVYARLRDMPTVWKH